MVAIIVPGFLPVPAVKGGAIETLITGLIETNEKQRLMELLIYSPYNKEAALASRNYKYSQFIWIRYSLINKVINLATRTLSRILKNQIPHFGVIQMLVSLKKERCDFVLVEGNEQILRPISDRVGVYKTFFHLHARLFTNPEVYSYCNKVITVSDYIRQEVLLNTEKSAVDVVTLRNCTDISKFNRDVNLEYRDPVRNHYKISGEEVVICFTGRIVKEKGVRELIEALILLDHTLPFKLLVVGSPGSDFGMSRGTTDYYSELLRLSDRIKGKVIFTGFVDNAEIPHILAASDISVIPSLYEEPGALTIFESLAAGLPIVTTDSGGTPEYINSQCSIVIARNENFVNNLSAALKGLIISAERRDAMGKAGTVHVQQYNYNKYYSDLWEILTNG